METPFETKKELAYCYFGYVEPSGFRQIAKKALAYILQLEQERDAAVETLKEETGCRYCAKYTFTEDYVSTDCLDCINKCNWEWRGVKEEPHARD